MPVNNALYDTEPWRDPRGYLAALAAITPARFGYLRRVLAATLGSEPAGRRVLDIGCGGGFLAEEFAALGYAVTGIDPSGPTIAAARTHAREAGLAIAYCVAPGEAMPFADGAFPVAYCCDVLEHVDDLDAVLAEAARVLAPGGLFLFDTINRTPLSKLIVIKFFQEWRFTRLVETNVHDWAMFIRPAELRAALARHGLDVRQIVGLNPAGSPLRALRALYDLKRGAITYAEAAARAPLAVGKRTPILYAGYAVKAR